MNTLNNSKKKTNIIVRLTEEELGLLKLCRDLSFDKSKHRSNYGLSSYIKDLIIKDAEKFVL